ncbi:MAG: response regulator [Deltaproteobacteria bacterium]|jgi:signal transduction histidine kinase/CheY-like chemotaxis protein/ABC-type amino acid transport substrate-binding protein|nr:response regulator [Deltaproteobacteria bacterium]
MHFISKFRLSAIPVLVALGALIGLASCQPADYGQRPKVGEITLAFLADFRNIPGVTAEEVQAVERLQAEGRVIVFGTNESNEAYPTRHRGKGGFLIRLGESFSEMLGLKFSHQFVDRRQLVGALDSSVIDLAGEITYDAANRQKFLMTTPIFERLIKVYRNKGKHLDRPPSRIGFLVGAGVENLIVPILKSPVEVFFVQDHLEAVTKLTDGTLDTFFDDAIADNFFSPYSAISSDTFLPIVNNPFSLATKDPSLAAVISILQKFLDAGGTEYLFKLNSETSAENLRFSFEDSLNSEQTSLLEELRARQRPIAVAAPSDDYPECFYNDNTSGFQGIAVDVLRELELITGLTFEIVNPPGTTESDLKDMLLSGQVQLIGSLNYIEEHTERLVMSKYPYSFDRYALLTTLSHPDIKLSQIEYQTVGLVRDHHFAEIFKRWFPQSRDVIYYRSMELAKQALLRGDIDFIMASNTYLLKLTNYLEQPVFKAGITFEEIIPSGFAYRIRDRQFGELIDQALAYVDLPQLQSHWFSRLFDYRLKFIKDSAPFLIIFCLLLLFSTTGLVRVNARNRRLNRNLESMVNARTSQLMAAQVDLEREKHFMSSMVDSCPVSLIITSDGKILFLNPMASSFLGRKVGECLKDSFMEQEVYFEYVDYLEKGTDINWWPTRFLRADGEARETLLTSFASDYYGEKAYMSWVTDVTELRNNARALILARDIAEDSARAKSEFLANMSHEIRTPMNAILGLTQLTLQTELTETQRDYLEKTAKAATSLVGIINDILDFSKIEAGKLLMEKIDFQLEDVLDGVINLFTFRASDKNLELLLSVDADVQTNLVGDPLRLSQVLNNLMGNAMKFTEKGGITLLINQKSVSQGTCELCFRVKDTGIGLSQEQIDNLFTAFNQADSSFTRRYGGTGLGLAISKSLVEMMDGKIWVEGRLGEGCVFSFTVRLGLGAKSRIYAVPLTFLKGRSAIAVDDYPEALEVLVKNLASLGLNVTEAGSGAEALRLLSNKSFGNLTYDLVVTDSLSGQIDATFLASELERTMDPKVRPILILTSSVRTPALGTTPSGSEAPEERPTFQAVISKPVTIPSLRSVLVEVFKVRQGKGRRRSSAALREGLSIAHLAGSKILLAEDNEVNQLVACRLLKNAGFEVDVANNGAEAVEMVKSGAYDLVLMDIQMPVMDGLTATKAIRALPEMEALPIVAMTAHAMSGDREQSLSVGMNDHVTKPINLPELFGALDRWLKPKNETAV